MRILFAIGNAQTSKAIVEQYKTRYHEEVEYKDVFYFKALLEEVKKDKEYDRIVISEDLEQMPVTSIEEIDRFLFNNIDKITDEIEASVSKIILICSDRRNRSDSLLSKLYGNGIYSMLLGDDRSISNLCDIIHEPKTKKQAKEYLRINYNSSLTAGDGSNDDEVDEVELARIIKYYEKLGNDTTTYVPNFDKIAEQYTPKQLKVIALCLPPKVQEVLRASDKYVYLFPATEPERVEQHEKKTLLDRLRKGKQEKEEEKKRRQEQEEKMRLEEERRKQEEERQRLEEEKRKQEEETKKKQEEEQRRIMEEARRKEEEERDRKQEEERRQAEERRRQEEIEREKRREEERRLRENENAENVVVDVVTPELVEKIEPKEQNIVTQESNEKEEAEARRLEAEKKAQAEAEARRLEEERKAQEEAEARRLEAEKKAQAEAEARRLEAEKKAQAEAEARRLEEEKKREESLTATSTEEYSNYRRTVYELPKDYKKVVALVGANKSGTTFIANAVAFNMSAKQVNIGLLDMTKDKSLYYIYNNDDAKLRKIAAECMKKLSDGIDASLPVNRYLHVYTSVPGSVDENRRNYKHKVLLETIKKNNNLTLIDCDFTTPIEYFEQASEIYIVQDLDILKLQETTLFLRELKNRQVDMSKIHIIINKYVKTVLTPKKIVEGLSYYNDPEMSFVDELLTGKTIYSIIPYHLENYAQYVEALYKNNMNFKLYTEDFKKAVEELCMQIYPVSGVPQKPRRGLFG